jgi:alanyl-tRNA synthetase
MLGFFSVEELGLDPKRIFITVYEDDEETKQQWLSLGVPFDHLAFTKEDNFWDIGVGPCGPCTEMFYDMHPEYGKENFHPDLHDGVRYLEFWNLVFSELRHNEDNSYTPLPRKNIDTGAGLERLCLILQGVQTNFQTDLFTPLTTKIDELTSYRIKLRSDASPFMWTNAIADHLRSICFMIADGEIPSSTMRGYVIRRLIRRSMRFGQNLEIEGEFLQKLVPIVVDQYKDIHPKLADMQKTIINIIVQEQKKFDNVLRVGLRKIERELAKLKESREVEATFVFSLFETYGFPVEMTKEILEEQKAWFDEDKVKLLTDKHKKQSQG